MSRGCEMTDVVADRDDSVDEADIANDAARYFQLQRTWEVPERAAARATAEPMQLYLDLMAEGPVVHTDDDVVQLLRMEDILYVNKNRNVRQASKYLGSNRPAIPLGLDGAEHTKYRRLLDPVFTARRVAPLAPQVRQLADDLIDGFIDKGE